MEFDREHAYHSFERAVDLPMLVLAAAVVPLVAVPFLVDLPDQVDRALTALDALIWAAFALELGVKTYLAPRRAHHLRTHWLEVLLVAAPFLRPLRVIRSARAMGALRSAHGVRVVRRRT